MKTRLTAIPTFILAFLILLAWTTPSFAQGIIIPPDQVEPWMPPYPQEPLTLQTMSVRIDVNDQYAHIRTSQIFHNNTGIDLEGTWVFPVPRGATISNFTLWLDGHELNSETLDADQAASIYHQIVATMRDPGLLEYVGDGLIQAHIYPIPAMGNKQIEMEYDWLIPMDSGLMRLDIPLKMDGYSIDRIGNLGVTIDIESPDELGTIYSPTHDVRVDRDGSYHATAGMEKQSYYPQGNFVLYVSRPEAAVGLNVLTHSTSSGEGYFLAIVAPEYKESDSAVIAKDFVCVLDTSGSMSGEKIEQARDALDFIFRNLNPDDRFQLITFATDIYPYYDGWSDANLENISDVRDFISGINSGGSTNIYGVLETALDITPGRDRPMYIIFLTDGLPTVGTTTDTAQITQHTTQLNSEIGARIFCFGVGDDVDYQFIDLLARENGGYTANVAPGENLEQPLSDFYSKIKSPVLTALEIDITGPRIYDMLPDKLPDLFLGSQLILTGRYVGTGRANIVLTGTVGDSSRRFEYSTNISENRSNDFIPRQWATRRVGYLLNSIRLYGENQETVDEIVDLAQRYGIITPYTSMLVTEDEMALDSFNVRGGPFSSSGLGGGGAGFNAATAPSVSSRQLSEHVSSLEEGSWDMDESLKGSVTYAGDKTFYMDDEGYWIDSEYDEENMDDPIEIVYLSDEYFELLTDEPDIAEYLSVGDALVVVYNDTVYKIVPDEP